MKKMPTDILLFSIGLQILADAIKQEKKTVEF